MHVHVHVHVDVIYRGGHILQGLYFSIQCQNLISQKLISQKLLVYGELGTGRGIVAVMPPYM